jgi:superfamily I DNA/RNA helicase
MSASSADRKRLVGPEPFLAVEAAAGAGKTHLACQLSVELGQLLPPWQSVLFLSHTNAARDVFRQRIIREPHRVVLRTLDSFVLEILSPYAQLLGLPDPPHPPVKPPSDWFTRARAKCLALLRKKPDIARAIITRFPVILADEHQDASTHQHEILLVLMEAGARLRVFGDALQAILTFDASIPGWAKLVGDAPVLSLSGSWRWAENPDFGAWLDAARSALVAGGPIALDTAPPCVRIVGASEPLSARWHEYPSVRAAIANEPWEESFVVAVRANADASRLAADPDLRVVVYEGANPPQIDQLIDAASGAEGNCDAMLEALLDFAAGVGQVEPSVPEKLRACLRLAETHHEAGVVAVADILRNDPTVSGCVAGLRAMYQHRSALGWNVNRASSVAAVRQLPRMDVTSENVRELIYHARRVNPEDVAPPRCVSTVHKVKGREFQHVLVPWLSAGQFADKLVDRHLLYVAMSRAMDTLTLVLPLSGPTPLVSLAAATRRH